MDPERREILISIGGMIVIAAIAVGVLLCVAYC